MGTHWWSRGFSRWGDTIPAEASSPPVIPAEASSPPVAPAEASIHRLFFFFYLSQFAVCGVETENLENG